MADGPDGYGWHDDAHETSEPAARAGRSPRRFRAVIAPACIAAVGGGLLLIPSLGILGLPFLLGGLAGAIISFFLAAVGNED